MPTLRSPRASRVLLPATFVIGLSAGPVLAQGTPEQREACTPDALRLCQDTIPDIARTEACMRRHAAELSPRCHAVFNTPPAGSSTRRAARAASDADRLADTGRRRTEPDAAPPDGERPPRRLAPAVPGERRQARRQAPDGDEAEAGGGPPDSYDAPLPGPRRFGPPGPYGGDTGGGPPDGYDESYPGPRGYGPPGPGPYGGRFADDGPPDDYAGPRGGPPGGDAPPDVRRYHYGPPDEAGGPVPRGGRRARLALRRLCARDMIDPRTCALVRRALAEER